MIVRAKGEDLEIFLGAEACTTDELPKKLAGLLTPEVQAELEDFRPSGRGGGPVLAVAVDREMPCRLIFEVLRAIHRAGFERLWVKCDGPEGAPAGQRPNGFLVEWAEQDPSHSPRVPVLVDIGHGGELSVNKSKPSLAELGKSLALVQETDPNAIVVARPREATPFEKLAAVWQLVARNKLILVDPEGTFAPTLPKPPHREPPK